MELITAYRASLGEFTGRVAQVSPEQWSAPTPCREWDVHTLVNHVVGEDLWTVPIFEGQTIAEVGDRFIGDQLGDDPAATSAQAAMRAEAAVTAPGAIERTVQLSAGDVPATEYVHQLLADHLVHAWDLAVAVGVDMRLDPEAVNLCAEWFTDREESYRASGIIADRVPVDETADQQDKLIAAFGRDPGWAP